MWRWVIKDYFAAFRWNRIKERMKGNDWFWTGYLLIGVPLIWGVFEKIEYAIIYYSMLVPVIFCLFSETIHENILPKLFYLCPMDKEQRRGYVERKFLFAMIQPAILGGIFAVILWAFRHCQPLTAIMYWVNVVIIGITTSSCFGKRKVYVSGHNGTQGKTLYTGGGIETSNFIVSFIAILGMCMILCVESSIESWAIWIFVSVAIFIQLPLIIKYLSGWNKAVENAVGYAKTKL